MISVEFSFVKWLNDKARLYFKATGLDIGTEYCLFIRDRAPAYTNPIGSNCFDATSTTKEKYWDFNLTAYGYGDSEKPLYYAFTIPDEDLVLASGLIYVPPKACQTACETACQTSCERYCQTGCEISHHDWHETSQPV